MGHPKALTRLGTETALERVVRACGEASVRHVRVVVGRDSSRIRAEHASLTVEWVVNPEPDAGRTGSLQQGLGGLESARVLMWPVDHPLVSPETVRRILLQKGELVVPTWEGRGGHPVVLGGDVLARVRRLAPSVPLRDAFERSVQTRVALDDPGVRANLDTPEDVRAWLGAG